MTPRTVTNRPSHRRTDRPQLERATPLIAIAAAREVVDEAARFLGQPLPFAYAAGLAARARVTFARSESFRRGFKHRADAGRERLYVYLRHWLAARLYEARPDLFARLPDDYRTGAPLSVASPVTAAKSVAGTDTAPLSPDALLLLGT